MTVTLFGRRRVRCYQVDGRPDVALACDPGSVYLAALTGALHSVEHDDTGREGPHLMDHPILGAVQM
eukprot:11479662-Alexandrium_andersonii.AAC.1